ncbi:MAG: NUDIX hydrolase [Acidobacteria bacterium]|nr:NUDIX hydrolase [Acidobacteriota bacterium]
MEENKLQDRFEWLKIEIAYQEKRSNELRWIITNETIKDKENETVFSRSVLRHPGVAAVAAINDKKEILLIEQFRYTFKTNMWEIPTGTLHGELKDGQVIAIEAPEITAARELSEEAGFCAKDFVLAQSFCVMPGTSDGYVYLFLAFGLSPKVAEKDIGEVVTKVKFFPIDQALAMINRGEIFDAKTIIGIYAAKNYLEKHSKLNV